MTQFVLRNDFPALNPIDVSHWLSACRDRSLATVSEAIIFLRPIFQYLKHERLCAILLRCNEVVGLVVAEGQRDRVCACPRSMVKAALLLEADGVILAHNHPSGNPAPSQADICFTRRITNLFRTLNILLLDHVIFANRDFMSFRQEGLL